MTREDMIGRARFRASSSAKHVPAKATRRRGADDPAITDVFARRSASIGLMRGGCGSVCWNWCKKAKPPDSWPTHLERAGGLAVMNDETELRPRKRHQSSINAFKCA